MKRVAVFAAYSSQGIIAPYVTYYLKALKEVVNDIVFVADNALQEGEENKISPIVTYARCERHGSYDFGSYRRGFEWVKQHGLLDEADELIFCNDSCYGPVFPFSEVMNKMENTDCDFWGMTDNTYHARYHLQSFFMLFKRTVFVSETFNQFVGSFDKQPDFWGYVEKYETMFTSVLMESGFKGVAYCPYTKLGMNERNVMNPCVFPVTLLCQGVPLIKRKVFINNHDGLLMESQKELMELVRRVSKRLFDIVVHDSYCLLLDNNLSKKCQEERANSKRHLHQMQRLIWLCVFLLLVVFGLLAYIIVC